MKFLKMKARFLRFAFVLSLCALCFGCQKKEKFFYTTLGDLGVEILDIEPIDESDFIVLGYDKVDHNINESTFLLCHESDGSKWNSSVKMRIMDKYNDVAFADGVVWFCGDNMFLSKSFDTLRTRQRHTKFTWWDEWPSEKTNLKEMYIQNGRPKYMIGTDDLLSGSFYHYAYSDTVYSGSKKKYGLNDMVVYNDDVYVAGYGSILRVTNNGKTETLENIGGENFTHICVGGDYLFACSYSGNIYRSEIGSNSWKKISTLGKKLLFIEANSKGDVIATGESKEILVSTNFGTEWREEKYSDGNKISCVVAVGDNFYIGTEKGVVLKVTHKMLSLNDQE